MGSNKREEQTSLQISQVGPTICPKGGGGGLFQLPDKDRLEARSPYQVWVIFERELKILGLC